MLSYNIKIDGDRVHLENANRDSIQMSQREYNLLMTYPMATKDEIEEILYNDNPALGRQKIKEIVNTSFVILGRD